MKLIATIAQQTIPVEVTRTGDAFVVVVGGRRYTIDVQRGVAGSYSLRMDNRIHEAVVLGRKESRTVYLGGSVFTVDLVDDRQRRAARSAQGAAAGPRALTAQMPGKVVRVLVREGDGVEQNQGLLVLEAMKMQNEIKASKSGRVTQVAVEPGKAVNAGDLLLVIE